MTSPAHVFPARAHALDVVAIGGSAGGLEALKLILSRLPSDFPATILVTLHVGPHGPPVLPWILSKAGPLNAEHPEEGDLMKRGRIYVAPPDRHLLVRGDRLHLSAAGRENGQRPAIDAMFRSVARSFGSRAVCVVLSGYLDDGTLGMAVIRARSGRNRATLAAR